LEDEVQLVLVTAEEKMIPRDAQRAMASRAGAEVVEVNRVSGKDRFSSAASRSINLAPHFSPSCRFENIVTNLPVQQEQFPVNRKRCAQLRRLNPAFHLCEELAVAVGARGDKAPVPALL